MFSSNATFVDTFLTVSRFACEQARDDRVIDERPDQTDDLEGVDNVDHVGGGDLDRGALRLVAKKTR